MQTYYRERADRVQWIDLNYAGIYRWLNLIDWKVYIGSALNVGGRNWPSNERGNILLRRAITKHGLENFEFDVMERCPEEFLNEREQYWMDFYCSYEREFGYNIAPIAGSVRGVKWNKESRTRGSEAQKKRFENPEELANHCVRMQKAQNEPEMIRKKSENAKTVHIRRKETLTPDEYVAAEARRIEASIRAREEKISQETEEEREARSIRKSEGASKGWLTMKSHYTSEEIAEIQAEKARLGQAKEKERYTPEELAAKKSVASRKAWETRRLRESQLSEEEREVKKLANSLALKTGHAKSKASKTEEELEELHLRRSAATKEGMARWKKEKEELKKQEYECSNGKDAVS